MRETAALWQTQAAGRVPRDALGSLRWGDQDSPGLYFPLPQWEPSPGAHILNTGLNIVTGSVSEARQSILARVLVTSQVLILPC